MNFLILLPPPLIAEIASYLDEVDWYTLRRTSKQSLLPNDKLNMQERVETWALQWAKQQGFTDLTTYREVCIARSFWEDAYPSCQIWLHMSLLPAKTFDLVFEAWWKGSIFVGGSPGYFDIGFANSVEKMLGDSIIEVIEAILTSRRTSTPEFARLFKLYRDYSIEKGVFSTDTIKFLNHLPCTPAFTEHPLEAIFTERLDLLDELHVLPLQELEVFDPELTTLTWHWNFRELKKLTLRGGKLKELTWSSSSQIETLDLRENQLTDFPAHLLSLPLTTLCLGGNPLRNFELSMDTGLRELDLAGCGLTEVPAILYTRFPSLSKLGLSNNRLTEVPFLPQQLNALYLRNNLIEQVPSDLLLKLNSLIFDISNNRLTEFKVFLDKEVKQKRYVSLGGNAFAEVTVFRGTYIEGKFISTETYNLNARYYSIDEITFYFQHPGVRACDPIHTDSTPARLYRKFVTHRIATQ